MELLLKAVCFTFLVYVYGYEEINAPDLSLGPLVEETREVIAHYVLKSELTATEKRDVVLEHNKLRRAVSPSAANMNALSWDDTLGKMAQQWSNECLFAHGNHENISPFRNIGQNIYIKYPTTTSPPIPLAVTRWHDLEVNHYNYTSNECDEGEVCGHYTQVVWAKTKSVGCGYAFCPEAKSGDKVYKDAWLMVCNYGEAGNFGGRPYIEGERCTKCSTGTCRGLLCRECDLGTEEKCDCRIKCDNCGTLDSTSCTCNCAAGSGYSGQFCDNFCEDKHNNCGVRWKKRHCKSSEDLKKVCPRLCEQCVKEDVDYVPAC